MISRGDICWFRFSAPDKRRPVLIVGNPAVLGSWSQIPVIPFSTQIRGLPWEVRLDSKVGLEEESVLKVEWIRSVDRAQIGPWIATFPEERWPDLRAAVIAGLGL